MSGLRSGVVLDGRKLLYVIHRLLSVMTTTISLQIVPFHCRHVKRFHNRLAAVSSERTTLFACSPHEEKRIVHATDEHYDKKFKVQHVPMMLIHCFSSVCPAISFLDVTRKIMMALLDIFRQRPVAFHDNAMEANERPNRARRAQSDGTIVVKLTPKQAGICGNLYWGWYGYGLLPELLSDARRNDLQRVYDCFERLQS